MVRRLIRGRLATGTQQSAKFVGEPGKCAQYSLALDKELLSPKDIYVTLGLIKERFAGRFMDQIQFINTTVHSSKVLSKNIFGLCTQFITFTYMYISVLSLRCGPSSLLW